MVEILVISGIFLGVVWMGFGIFQFGVGACQLSNSRANLQTSATRVMLSLQNDLRRSSYNSVTSVRRTVTFGGRTYRRDAICLGAVSNWSAPASLNTQFGVPNFDRFVIYYATTDNQSGQLIRSQVQDPAPPDGSSRTISNFVEATRFNNDPRLNDPEQISYTLLGDGVDDFSVGDGVFDASVRASLSMTRAGLRGPTEGSKMLDQSYQMGIELTPQNTSPHP